MSTIQIYKNGIVSGSNIINPNMVNFGYSRNPNMPNTAGNTILSVTVNNDYTRYTCTTAGSDGGKYGYPCGSSGLLVNGTVYTWSCEVRASVAFSYASNSRGRFGFEGNGMLTGSAFSVTTDWTKISYTWTQTTSQAFVIYVSGSLPVGEWLDIRNLKCEEGSICTPFIIPSNETTRYVGNNHGFIETGVSNPRVKLYPGYIESKEFIEI